jgi:hypothetical protein
MNIEQGAPILKTLADLLRRFSLTTTRPRRIAKKKKKKKNFTFFTF